MRTVWQLREELGGALRVLSYDALQLGRLVCHLRLQQVRVRPRALSAALIAALPNAASFRRAPAPRAHRVVVACSEIACGGSARRLQAFPRLVHTPFLPGQEAKPKLRKTGEGGSGGGGGSGIPWHGYAIPLVRVGSGALL